MSFPSVGIVVPTLGSRPHLLTECLTSIRGAGNAYVLVVAPKSADLSEAESLGLIDFRVEDPAKGLPAAINFGIQSLPQNIEFFNWLGDDDKLMIGALDTALEILRNNRKAPYVFGGCNYIDINGRKLATNYSGNWARLLLRIGPDLIPQPGALIRRSSFEQIGGLDTRYGWAFDLEMFIQLSKIGKGQYAGRVLSEFRWHDGSLTVGARDGSSREARAIRKAHLPEILKPFTPLWEIPFHLLGKLAVKKLSTAVINKK